MKQDYTVRKVILLTFVLIFAGVPINGGSNWWWIAFALGLICFVRMGRPKGPLVKDPYTGKKRRIVTIEVFAHDIGMN